MKMSQTQAQTKDPESATAPAPPLSIPLYFCLHSPENWKLASSSLLTVAVADRLNMPAGRRGFGTLQRQKRREETDALTRVCLLSANATQMGAYKSPLLFFPLPPLKIRLLGYFTQDKGGDKKMQGSDVNVFTGG